MFYRILVAADGSMQDDKAMNAAIELAQSHPNSMIIGLSVTRPMPSESLLTGEDMVDYELHEHELALDRADRIAELARSAGVACETIVEQSHLAEGVAHAAIRHNCNCVFAAAHGSNGLEHRFNDNSPWRKLAEASIPVIIYR